MPAVEDQAQFMVVVSRRLVPKALPEPLREGVRPVDDGDGQSQGNLRVTGLRVSDQVLRSTA